MASEFCMNFNSKPNRNKLVHTLFTVTKNRLLVIDRLMIHFFYMSRMDLIGYYVRLVATLNPILIDIAPQLVEMLIKEFQVSQLI